jgi:hypothetical protein
MDTDMDIVKSVSDNPEIIKFMLENLEEAEVSTNDEALEKIGSRVAAGQAKEYQKKRLPMSLDRYYCLILAWKRRIAFQRHSSSLAWPKPVSSWHWSDAERTIRIITPTRG